jgi:ABC-2 type transport system permease protein
MLRKEFLQMLRDPRMRMVLFIMPLVQMMIVANALNTDISHVGMALLDLDNSPASRELTRRFTAGDQFRITAVVHSPQEMTELLDSGKVRAALYFQAGFSNDLGTKAPARVQFLTDGTRSNDSAIMLTYAQEITTTFALERSGNSPTQGLDILSRAWFNPNLESRYYYIPGLIAVMLMLISIFLASIAIVREKEIGTIEQVMVTPIRKLEFILGKTLPYLVTGYVIMILMFILAWLAFGVRVKGSWLLLLAATGIYILGNLGLALLISTSARTQQQALLTAFFVLVPGVLLSGFMFPIHNMPMEVQYLTMLNPMRWYLEIMHGIAEKGTGLGTLWPSFVSLGILACASILLATKIFRKTLS